MERKVNMELKNNQDFGKNEQGAQDELLKIIEQLEWCGYECQGGPLEMNTAFIRLKEIAHGCMAPAKLDRSRWEGCDYCNDPNPARDCILPDRTEQFLCSRDGLFGDCYVNTRKINFCPMCGHPLTEEAWAELERRIKDGAAD